VAFGGAPINIEVKLEVWIVQIQLE